MQDIKSTVFQITEDRIMISKGVCSITRRTNSQKRQILLLLYFPHEEEGTRMKEGRKRHVGRGSCYWLEES